MKLPSTLQCKERQNRWSFGLLTPCATICCLVITNRGKAFISHFILRNYEPRTVVFIYKFIFVSALILNIYSNFSLLFIFCKVGLDCCYYYYLLLLLSRGSSVGIALGYGLDDRGSRVRFSAGAGNFSFSTASRKALGLTQPPIQWEPGALSLGLRRPGREANHSPPSSAEVKNAWSYTSTPPIRLHGVLLS
jgi:hypothetical protein